MKSRCSSGKKRFPTEHSAGQALVSAKIRHYLHGHKKRQEQRYYACDQCQGWHLTSWATPNITAKQTSRTSHDV